jgi:hydroxyacylglutathione hydrolase
LVQNLSNLQGWPANAFYLKTIGEMRVETVARGVERVALLPWDVVNVYIVDDILVDAGGRLSAKRLLAALSGRAMRAHALTHAHLDHQGSSHAICERLQIPLWCGAGDVLAVESGNQAPIFAKERAFAAAVATRLAGPPHQVSRHLHDGDEVGSFTAVEAPGHTPGHMAYWRSSDRVLIIGDVLFNRNPVTLKSGLQEPFRFATADTAMNRRSARRLAELDPAIVCFGHGAPLKDMEELKRFVDRLHRD